MIRSIMVPTDGSSRSLQAVPHAVAIARAAGATLTLVQVHTPLPLVSVPGAPALYDDGLYKASFELEKHELQETAVHIEAESGVHVGFSLERGAAVDGLLAYARAHAVDLIVMSTHGRTGASRAWLGSVADELVRTSHVPVLLRRVTRRRPAPGEAGINRILVPLDGSAESESVLQHAADIGKLSNARYMLLRVQAPVSSFGMTYLLEQPGYEQTVRAHYEHYLERVRELLPKGSAVDIHVMTHRSPASAIVKLAEDTQADLIAIATKGRKGIARFALGSVADKVVRGSSTPLLIYCAGGKEDATSKARITEEA